MKLISCSKRTVSCKTLLWICLSLQQSQIQTVFLVMVLSSTTKSSATQPWHSTPSSNLAQNIIKSLQPFKINSEKKTSANSLLLLYPPYHLWHITVSHLLHCHALSVLLILKLNIYVNSRVKRRLCICLCMFVWLSAENSCCLRDMSCAKLCTLTCSWDFSHKAADEIWWKYVQRWDISK